MIKMIVNTLAIALIVSATTAFGAVREGSFSVTPVIGGYVYDGGQHLDSTLVLGVRAGYNITKAIGVEALYDYVADSSAPSVSLNDISLQRFGGQALYHFFPDNALVPYLAAGYSRINFTGAGVNNKNHGEFDYGAGVKYFLTDVFAVRGDIRHILYNYESKTFNNAEITLGAYFQFGGAAPAVKAVAAASEQTQPSAPVKTLCPPVPEPVACAPVACTPAACIPVACTPAQETVKIVPVPVTREACEPLWSADAAKAAAVAVTPRDCEKPAAISIYYGSDRVVFKVDYHDELDKVGSFLKEFPNSRVTIAGHADSDGSKEENLQLSLVRAAVARSHIMYKFKIDRSRIAIKGYGSTRPVASNNTAAGKARNRRIEIVFSCE